MNKKLLRVAVAIIAATMQALPSLAQIPEGYYQSLKGKKGAELKVAIYNIIKDANVLSYGSGKGHTWWGFWVTDRNSQGYFIDRYSNESQWVKGSSQGSVGSGMNIEHSFPKSWWGGSKNQAYQDLYNLMPCESGINSKKSNYPMGEVTSSDNGNGWTKVGNGADGSKYWEPADTWKGDFARGYMYMATAYQNFSWVNTGLQILEKNTYPTLQKWAYTLFIKWAKADKPDEVEINRNEEVYKIQGNRNPFVDFPNLMEYVWGDSTNYAFNPETTLKSAEYNNNYGGNVTPTPNPEETVTIYSAQFTNTDGNCKENIIKNESSNSNIWQRTTKYGWKATAYTSADKQNHAANATLTLPEIDLTDYQTATLSLSQAINFAKGKAKDYLSVEVEVTESETGETTTGKLIDFDVPTKDSWNFSDYTLNLNQYCGGRIKLSFRYTSDETICSTWEIKQVSISGTKVASGISNIKSVTDGRGTIDFSQPYQMYTASGRRISLAEGYKGMLIIRQGNNTKKIVRY